MNLRIPAVVGALLIASPAMALDIATVILDSEDMPACTEPVKDGAECPLHKVLTAGRAIRGALYGTYADEQNISGDEKFRRAELAFQLTGAGDVKLKAEEVVLIKKLVAKAYPPLVVYRVWQLLEK